ncbi:hypothetical protein CHS0354_034134 [Potamilus streckersoni]|uniref:Uncharacterized protein n=1 Tax=Potamilus streckersoni TaxID=2493646 RepID=A0AAE0TDW5_9BIVA|nr:hypothetical protein CHS0354_034134 [Potamilus streckersoni]
MVPLRTLATLNPEQRTDGTTNKGLMVPLWIPTTLNPEHRTGSTTVDPCHTEPRTQDWWYHSGPLLHLTQNTGLVNTGLVVPLRNPATLNPELAEPLWTPATLNPEYSHQLTLPQLDQKIC